VSIIAFIYFTDIFVLLLCSTVTVPTQDPHAQPPNMRRVVRAIRTPCRVPAACSPRHRRSANDGLCRIDGTCGLVAFGDPHVPPFTWGDHGDAAACHHDPWSPHRRHASFWDGVSKRVERLRRGYYRPSTPPTFPQTKRIRR
jgi:hypothetical protein